LSVPKVGTDKDVFCERPRDVLQLRALLNSDECPVPLISGEAVSLTASTSKIIGAFFHLSFTVFIINERVND
jgi:hypothetical protein